MKVTFLGTGTSQGVPPIACNHPVCLSLNPKDKRLRSSVLIETNGLTLLVDCGPDFRQQMLTNPIDKIDAILFTHEHTDHVLGLDDIRSFCYKYGHMPLYAHQRVLDALRVRFDYIFNKKNTSKNTLGVVEHTIHNAPFFIDKLKVEPIDALHYKLQIFGFKIKNFAYLTDIKTIETAEINKIKNIDVLVVNALRIEPHISHFNLTEALDFIKKVNPKTAYLTHVSHLLGFHDDVQQQLSNNVFLAYDNLKIDIL